MKLLKKIDDNNDKPVDECLKPELMDKAVLYLVPKNKKTDEAIKARKKEQNPQDHNEQLAIQAYDDKKKEREKVLQRFHGLNVSQRLSQ